MKKRIATKNQIKQIYKQICAVYYLVSILNKIIVDEMEFNYMEITTISTLSEKQLKSLKKEILNLIPL